MDNKYKPGLISVCVPTYKRPDTLEQLIHSFLRQTYKNKELVISDDSPDNSIKDLVSSFNNKSIRYFRNKTSIGFSDNYLKALLYGQGEFLLSIGDDDIFISPDTLQQYADTFKKHPNVYFVYSNQVQFSPQLEIEYVITMFKESTYYKTGKDAVTKLLVNSIFIGGIGIRNQVPLKEFYAQKKILHPQVELIGNILSIHDAYTLKNYLIGVRSHEEQIIYKALKDKKIRLEGNHMNIELFQIFDRLRKKYNYSFNDSFLGKRLIPNNVIMLFKEKMILGNSYVTQNYSAFCKISNEAKKSVKLRIAYTLALIMPGFFIHWLRIFMFKILRLINRTEFNTFKKNLLVMIKD